MEDYGGGNRNHAPDGFVDDDTDLVLGNVLRIMDASQSKFAARAAAWYEWKLAFRKLYSPALPVGLANWRLRQLFNLNAEDVTAKVMSATEKTVANLGTVRESESTWSAIAVELANMDRRFDELNASIDWRQPKLARDSVYHFKHSLIPLLGTICGVSHKHSYGIVGRHYERTNMFEERWETTRSVTMVHINGGLFRRQRLQWQIAHAGKTVADNEWPDAHRIESNVDGFVRSISEVTGEEPWNLRVLSQMDVVIASETLRKSWMTIAKISDYESFDVTVDFWCRYLKKLSRLKRELFSQELMYSLRQTDYLDFIGHYFNQSTRGGIVVGAHLIFGKLAPLAFEVEWPKTMEVAPEPFSDFQAALDRLLRNDMCKTLLSSSTAAQMPPAPG